MEALPLLAEVSRRVRGTVDLDGVLEDLLALLAQQLGVVRAAIALLNRDTKEIQIDAAYGLTPDEQNRGRYQVGEGVTGNVVRTQRPVILERIDDDPDFLNRTGAHSDADASFVCVPIVIDDHAIGALSVDVPSAERRELERLVEVLGIVATMIAQTAASRQSVAEVEEQIEVGPASILGRSRAIKPIIEMVHTVAESDATVLIRGESGVGKELVANAIHYASARKSGPLIKVNCAALAAGVLESELFGHEKGAFTGAAAERKGRFEVADGGTIFLDEIGDFPASTQIMLLRVLQEKSFERVGGNRTITSDVRIVAATNRDLEALMADGSFRQDLYYRLAVFPIHVPPLRERRTDILLLADAFVEKYAKQLGKDIQRITSQAIDMLMVYHWPGNVRELENCIERAVLLTRDGVIHAHHLPPTLQTAEATGTSPQAGLEATLAAVERDLIHDALKTSRGNMAEAARSLGLTERKMGLRIRRFEIDPKRYRLRR
ncbi:MAG: sigma 54-interacting transcriptional regulator [Deltaproteobacteria bacterium]